MAKGWPLSGDLSDPRTFRWVEAGISGIPRSREWDAVAAARCDTEGDEAVFVLLDDGRLLPLHGAHEAMEPAARALEGELETPYRAVAVRREANMWAVGAVAIEVAELPADTEGEELMLTLTQEGERALEVDGRPTLEGIEAVERAAADRYDAYVLRARRLDGRLWEIGIDPL
jgi:hypothetical protein